MLGQQVQLVVGELAKLGHGLIPVFNPAAGAVPAADRRDLRGQDLVGGAHASSVTSAPRPTDGSTALSPYEGSAAGHSLCQALFDRDVDGAAHGPDRQAGLLGQIGDRGQLRGDLAAGDLFSELPGELLVGVLG